MHTYLDYRYKDVSGTGSFLGRIFRVNRVVDGSRCEV